ETRLEAVDQLVVQRLLDEHPGAGAAHLALVEEDAVDDALDRLVDRRVGEDDVRGLAAQLQRRVLAGAGDLLRDALADRGRAGEGDLVDPRVADDGGTGRPRAGDDVDDAGRQLGLLEQVGEQQRRQWRGLRRL